LQHDYWVAGTYTISLTVTDDEGETGTASTVVTVTTPPLPEPEAAITDLMTMIIECHDPDGNPIDPKIMDNLLLKVETSYDIVSMRKSGGSSQSAEMRKSGGANLMVVFISMTESYTLYGKIDTGDAWSMVTKAAFVVSLLGQKVTIDGVPNYKWFYGCGPTAAAMILGYWDAHGFEELLRGESWLQSPDVNAMIASPEHIWDYAMGVNGELYDEFTDVIWDLSQWQPNDPDHPYPPHADNCIADFMKASFSSEHLTFGQSLASNFVAGIEGYTAIAPSMAGSTDQYVGYANEMHMASFKWDDLKAQIDSGHPLAGTVDSDGDGTTDHLVPIIGYCEIASARVYAFYSTWDNSVSWASFEPMQKNVCFGVFSGYTFDIVDMTPPG
jgi:PKD repeat protein